MTEAKKLIDRIWDVIERGQLDQLPDLFDSDVHMKMPGIELRGVAGLRQMLEAYLAAFPDLKHHVHHHVDSGDTIAVELTVTGTHTGTMVTPQGSIPATGKKVTWESCDYIRTRNGKCVSWHVYHDSVPFLTALGLLPPPR